MKKRQRLTFQRHLELFLVWVKLVGQSFPPLWAAATCFAPLVLARCPVCERPRYVFWVPVGDHAVCDRIDPDQGQDEPLPPFM